MSEKRIVFSPVTRLSGLLSLEVFVEHNEVVEANAMATMFRGFEWIMCDRMVTDAVYMTQRICGICSLAHGAAASYLLDDLYDNSITENAQYVRNLMYAADFLQNHIRHFYLFSLPDFVQFPDRPPFHGQNLNDARLNPENNVRLVEHYFEAIKAAQRSHEILTLFGGKAPHQHSFVHGGVAVTPTVDKINRAQFLLKDVSEFVNRYMLPDTHLIAKAYDDYFYIGTTPKRFLSFGLFRFGLKNEITLLPSGVLVNGFLSTPRLDLITEDITHSWFEDDANASELHPNPYKKDGYSWVKSVSYGGQHFEVGPLARMTIAGRYEGGTSTMDRICARSLETWLLTELMRDWLKRIEPGPPPINQNDTPVKNEASSITDAMRGALLHSARISNERIIEYNVITPTVWNFSPKDSLNRRGPAESALMGTQIPRSDTLFTILGRIIRSFDPCMSCATHVIDAANGEVLEEKTF